MKHVVGSENFELSMKGGSEILELYYYNTVITMNGMLGSEIPELDTAVNGVVGSEISEIYMR